MNPQVSETLESFLRLRSFVHEHERASLVYGVSFAEYLILRQLHRAPDGVKRVDLAGLVGLTVSGVTRALAPLEKAGYVESSKQTEDARVRKVKLSQSAQELFEDIDANVMQRMAQLAPSFAQLIDELSRIR